MPFSKGAIFGSQVGAGLQSGLNAALQQQMQIDKIKKYASTFGLNPNVVAAATLGLNPVKSGGPSLQDQILYSVLQKQFPDLKMPGQEPSGNPYAPYMAQPQNTPYTQPSILNTQATGTAPNPSGNMPGQVIGGKTSGAQAIIQANEAGKTFTTPKSAPSNQNFGVWELNGQGYQPENQDQVNQLKNAGAKLISGGM